MALERILETFTFTTQKVVDSPAWVR